MLEIGSNLGEAIIIVSFFITVVLIGWFVTKDRGE